jgi:hypothetical protein
MGPNGERLKRGQWLKPVEGELSIHLGRDNFVATLDRMDVDRQLQVLYPIFDVRVQTFDEGLLVIGYCIVPETPTREVRQAWYCVPSPNPNARRGMEPQQ